MKAHSLGLALLLAASCLAGCSATTNAVHALDQADRTADLTVARMPKPIPALGNPAVAHVDTMYFGQSVYRRRRGDDFPPRADQIVVRSAGDVDLRGFAALITKASGIPVALNIAKAPVQAVSAAPAAPMPGLSVFNPATGAPVPPPGSPQAAPQGSKPGAMSVLWDGPLAGLLDLGAARFGVDWEYRDGVVQMSDERTETFVIHALPTTSSLDSQLTTTAGSTGGTSGGSAGGGAATQGATTNGAASLGASQKATLDVWTDIKTALGVIVGDRGRFAITPSNGTVTVTAAPAVLTQVATYVRQQNAILTRQVFVRVRVYAVSGNDSDDAALSFNAIFQNAAKTYGLSFVSPGAAPANAVGAFTGTIIDTKSELNGSKMVAQALSQTSRASLITELNLSALNNRPVSQQSVRSTTYVAQTAVTNGQYTTTTQLIPASLTTGFTVSLLPRIISDDRILMDYSINLSSLVGLVSQSSGGQTLQLPTTDSDQGMQETELRSGQVLMLNGYIADSAADARQGTGAPSNYLLGGTRSASTSRKRIIVTMEPVITSGSDS